MTNFREVEIDEVRHYWDRRPCNIRHSLAPIGTRQYFDEVEKRKYFVEPHIPVFADFPRWAGRRVLEVGCGIGTDTINFARAGADVTAVDLSGESIALARRRAEVFGLEDRIEFVEGNAEELDAVVEPAEFDLIYSFGVIHHAPHPERIVAQWRSHYCGPETLVKVMVYNKYSWKVLQILLRNWKLGPGLFDVDELVAKSSEAESGCPVTYTYTRRSVRSLLEGFEVRDIFVDHIFPYRVRDYVNYSYVREPWIRPIPDSAWRHIERLLGWHLCVNALPA